MGSGYIVQRGGGKDYSAFKTFVDRSITEVTAEMLDGATEIGNSAFYNCISLKSVDIPNGVTSIGSYAFYNCRALTSVTVEATTPPTLGTDVFSNTHADLVIYVPAGSVDTYKSASGWLYYASRIQAIPST